MLRARADSLGVYISVPFCRSKCTYCNFASGVYSQALHQQYVARVCAEIEGARRRAARWGVDLPQRVDSVYLGGGTPSALSPLLLRRLWHALRRQFDIVKTSEITMECAPGQLDGAALDAMVECGVNRVSFGVQSFVDREAAAAGRLHTREVALADLRRVRAAGIERVNVDLIAGLPHQNPSSWQKSLQTLVSAGVDHASVYMLEVDGDSRLGRELLAGGSRYHARAAPGDEMTADFYETAILWLEQHGLEQYEISNFARPGNRSRHNEKYWRRRPYLGFGLDAHSMLRAGRGSALRFATGSSLDEYLEYPNVPEAVSSHPAGLPAMQMGMQELTAAEEAEEAWFLGLRLRDGVEWRALVEEFGETARSRFQPVVNELCQLGLVTGEKGIVRLTRRGLLLSNEVFARFLDVDENQLQIPAARSEAK